MRRIKFGTDGWRGLIGNDFTFENVRVVAQAISDYLKKERLSSKAIAVGYDTRFLSDKFAEAVSEVLVGNGMKVILADRPIPTPVLSFAIKKGHLSGGIMVTASHNPAQFNGIKFKASFAGPADPIITDKIENFLFKSKIKTKPIKQAKKEKSIKLKNLSFDYIKSLRSYIDIKLLKRTKLKVLIDSMYGTGIGYIAKILEDTPIKIKEIRNHPDPLFGGIKPEPIEHNLKELSVLVKEGNFDIGLANDGDADRIGAMRGDGKFINPHQILSLLLLHMVEDKKWRGGVVKTLSVTSLIDNIAQRFNLKLYETPIGFKHICRLMLKENILIGGEESGGFGFRNYTLERDGILAALLLLEMVAYRRQSIIEIIADMERRFGRFRYRREDIECRDFIKTKEKFCKIVKSQPSRLLNKNVVEVKTYDGLKFILSDRSWLLFRLSGTEPILRIYAEASSQNQADALAKLGKKMMGIS